MPAAVWRAISAVTVVSTGLDESVVPQDHADVVITVQHPVALTVERVVFDVDILLPVRVVRSHTVGCCPLIRVNRVLQGQRKIVPKSGERIAGKNHASSYGDIKHCTPIHGEVIVLEHNRLGT